MGLFERYLTFWVAGAISIGVGLGSLFPAMFYQVAEFEYASVNYIVAILNMGNDLSNDGPGRLSIC